MWGICVGVKQQWWLRDSPVRVRPSTCRHDDGAGGGEMGLSVGWLQAKAQRQLYPPAPSGPFTRPIRSTHPLHQIWEAHVHQEALELAIADR